MQWLKGKISKSIPRIQLLLTKLSPMQLFELELYIEREYASALPNREGITRIQRYLRMRPVGVTFSCFTQETKILTTGSTRRRKGNATACIFGALKLK